MGHGGIEGIIKSGKFPGVRGLKKGPNMSVGGRRFQKHFDRVDTVAEVEAEYRAWESTGTMTEEQKKTAQKHLDDLRAKKASGEIKVIDYQVEGHPLEKPIPKDGEDI